MVSPSSSDRRRAAPRWLLLVLALSALTGGCVTVQPQDKEYLADPSMTFGGEGPLSAEREHVHNNREASFGGGGVSGGGCGCN